MIRAILVDDNEIHLEAVEKALELYANDIEIIGKYTRTSKAIPAIIHLMPDVLFLDIQMPGMDGFKLAAAVKNICSNVIYLSSHMEYAPKSYSEDALFIVQKSEFIDMKEGKKQDKFLPIAIAKLKAKLKERPVPVTTPLPTFQKISMLTISGNRKISLVLSDDKTERTCSFRLKDESDKTLSRFVFFKKLIYLCRFHDQYINQKDHEKIFPNLAQSKANLIKDINYQLSEQNAVISQDSFFSEGIRGNYCLALDENKIVLPSNPTDLEEWVQVSLRPIIDKLELPCTYYTKGTEIKVQKNKK